MRANPCAGDRAFVRRLRGRHGLVAHGRRRTLACHAPTGREVQALLMRRGYDLDGKADGVIGPKRQRRSRIFKSRSGLHPDGRACASVLAGYAESEAALFRRMKSAGVVFIHDCVVHLNIK